MKSYDTNVYENELSKRYNRTLTKYTHLIAKLHLEDTACITILLELLNWQTARPSHKLKVKGKANKLSKSVEPHPCAFKIKYQFFDNWLTKRNTTPFLFLY